MALPKGKVKDNAPVKEAEAVEETDAKNTLTPVLKKAEKTIIQNLRKLYLPLLNLLILQGSLKGHLRVPD